MKANQKTESVVSQKPRKDRQTQRTTSKKRKTGKSKSQDKTKTEVRKKKKKADSKKFIEETNKETEKVLTEIREQLEGYQDKLKGKEILDKKEKIAKLSSELTSLTRERNNLRLSYDTERLKWKEEKGKLNDGILASCVLAGQLDLTISELASSIATFKQDHDNIHKLLKQKESQFDEVNQANVGLEGEMTRAGSPMMQQYEKDHFKDTSTRILQMIDFEHKKQGTLEQKLEEKNKKIEDLKLKIESSKKESQEVNQCNLV